MTTRRWIAVISLALIFSAGMSWTMGADAAIVPKESAERFELIFWDAIKDSEDAADYEAYLEAYPEGRFAPLAKARAKSLRGQQAGKRGLEEAQIEVMDEEFDVVRNASLREGPDVETKRLGTLKAGTRVIVTGRVVDKNWYRVETTDGQSGFVFGKLLEEAQSRAVQSAAAPAGTASVAQPAQRQPEEKKAKVALATPTAPAVEAPAPSPEKELKTFKDCSTCPEMVALVPGSFTMGSKAGDATELPVRRVTIDYPFAIGRYEVTVAEWKACHDAGGCEYMPSRKGMTPRSPVYNLSWLDAQQYVKWLSKTTGKNYRLPSEAEWEYAARGGTKTEFWWGNEAGDGKANCRKCGGEWDKKTPALVDAFEPNPFGLFGMNGGVWEWGSDCWFETHKGAPRDGKARDRKDCTSRVLRGGSWRNDATYARAASRFNYDADVRFTPNGFRVVRSAN